MPAITADMVKDLREKTGVGMMECKKALSEAEGDFAGAEKILRERGIAKAGKRTERVAAEGLAAIAIAPDKSRGVVVELNSETDFVARNDEFAALVQSIANAGLEGNANCINCLGPLALPSLGKTVANALEDIVTKIGEKIELTSYEKVSGDIVAGYVHPPGKIGVLVGAKVADGDAAKRTAIEESLREIAMHIAAASPRYLKSSDVDEATLAAERDIYANKARNEGKPENIVPKIVEGGVRSFFKENVLLEQGYVKDDKQSVGQVVAALAKSTGLAVELTGFARVKVGGKAAAKAVAAG